MFRRYQGRSGKLESPTVTAGQQDRGSEIEDAVLLSDDDGVVVSGEAPEILDEDTSKQSTELSPQDQLNQKIRAVFKAIDDAPYRIPVIGKDKARLEDKQNAVRMVEWLSGRDRFARGQLKKIFSDAPNRKFIIGLLKDANIIEYGNVVVRSTNVAGKGIQPSEALLAEIGLKRVTGRIYGSRIKKMTKKELAARQTQPSSIPQVSRTTSEPATDDDLGIGRLMTRLRAGDEASYAEGDSPGVLINPSQIHVQEQATDVLSQDAFEEKMKTALAKRDDNERVGFANFTNDILRGENPEGIHDIIFNQLLNELKDLGVITIDDSGVITPLTADGVEVTDRFFASLHADPFFEKGDGPGVLINPSQILAEEQATGVLSQDAFEEKMTIALMNRTPVARLILAELTNVILNHEGETLTTDNFQRGDLLNELKGLGVIAIDDSGIITPLTADGVEVTDSFFASLPEFNDPMASPEPQAVGAQNESTGAYLQETPLSNEFVDHRAALETIAQLSEENTFKVLRAITQISGQVSAHGTESAENYIYAKFEELDPNLNSSVYNFYVNFFKQLGLLKLNQNTEEYNVSFDESTPNTLTMAQEALNKHLEEIKESKTIDITSRQPAAPLTAAMDGAPLTNEPRPVSTALPEGDDRDAKVVYMRETIAAHLGLNDEILAKIDNHVFENLVDDGFKIEKHNPDTRQNPDKAVTGYTLSSEKTGDINVSRSADGKPEIKCKTAENEEQQIHQAIAIANQFIIQAEAESGKPIEAGSTLTFTLSGSELQRAIVQAQLEKLGQARGGLEIVINTQPPAEALSEEALNIARGVVGFENFASDVLPPQSILAETEISQANDQPETDPTGLKGTSPEDAEPEVDPNVSAALDVEESSGHAAEATFGQTPFAPNGYGDIKITNGDGGKAEMKAALEAAQVKDPRSPIAVHNAQLSVLALLAENQGAINLGDTLSEIKNPGTKSQEFAAHFLAEHSFITPENVNEDSPIEALVETALASITAASTDDHKMADGNELSKTQVENLANHLGSVMKIANETALLAITGQNDNIFADLDSDAGVTAQDAADNIFKDDDDSSGAAESVEGETPAVTAETEAPADDSVKARKAQRATERHIRNNLNGTKTYDQAQYAKALATSIVEANQHLIEQGTLPDEWKMPSASVVKEIHNDMKRDGELDAIKALPEDRKQALKALLKDRFQEFGVDARDDQLNSLAKFAESKGLTNEIAASTLDTSPDLRVIESKQEAHPLQEQSTEVLALACAQVKLGTKILTDNQNLEAFYKFEDAKAQAKEQIAQNGFFVSDEGHDETQCALRKLVQDAHRNATGQGLTETQTLHRIEVLKEAGVSQDAAAEARKQAHINQRNQRQFAAE